MDGFKNSTRTKYMCGGPVKKATGGPVKMREGGTFNERGKRATMAEDRRMSGRKAPVEGVSSRPTDSSGRRATDADLGMTAPAKKAMPKGMGAMSNRDMQMLKAKETAKKKAMPKVMSDLERARAMVTRPLPMKKGGVPAHSDRPLIRRSKGGLSAMPKGKC